MPAPNADDLIKSTLPAQALATPWNKNTTSTAPSNPGDIPAVLILLESKRI
jgi:hypothetical protein